MQVDLVAAEELGPAREQFELLRATPNVVNRSDAVNPLVIDDQGRCLPLVYGTDPSYEVARIPSGAGAAEFRPNAERLERIATLLQLAFREAERPGASYVDWFAHLARVSRRFDHASLPTAGTAEQR